MIGLDCNNFKSNQLLCDTNSFSSYSYAFSTVPTVKKEKFKKDSLAVLRVKNLSGQRQSYKVNNAKLNSTNFFNFSNYLCGIYNNDFISFKKPYFNTETLSFRTHTKKYKRFCSTSS